VDIVMSNQKEIVAIRAKIKKKERELYRANKEMNAWSKSGTRSYSNAKLSNLFVETQQKEISELQAQLLKLGK
jgi:hypothetical protein